MTESRPHIPAEPRWAAPLAWLIPSLTCIAVYWQGFYAWFLADDFVWLSLRLQVLNGRSLWSALFDPTGHGTFRPLSERAFFLLFHELFGLNALPYRICILVTFLAALALLSNVMTRLTGSRFAGFLAAMFWVVNPALSRAMTWYSSYMHILCPFFLLLAFYFLLRHIETGEWRFYWFQLAAFTIGFGVLETNLVYPVLAAGYTFFFARTYFRRTLPLFGLSLAYYAFHTAIAPKQRAGIYGMHFDASMLDTFWTYWKWAVVPVQIPDVWIVPTWAVPAALGVLTAILAAFLIYQTARRRFLALYLFGWFVILIGPMLPLLDHRQYYYLTLPLMGLSAFAAYATLRGWQLRGPARVATILLAGTWIVLAAPVARLETNRQVPITFQAERIVRAVERVVRTRPRSLILLTGVDSDTFWWTIWDRPFTLVGAREVFLPPGSESKIEPRPGNDISAYILPAIPKGSDLARTVVLAVDKDMRNVTTEWVREARLGGPPPPPRQLSVAHPLAQQWIGAGWYNIEGDSRWMGKRAELKIGGPTRTPATLVLTGYCVPQQLKEGPLRLSVAVDGTPLSPAQIQSCENAFQKEFPLPPETANQKSMNVVVEVNRTLTVPQDERQLGLIFGTFEVR